MSQQYIYNLQLPGTVVAGLPVLGLAKSAVKEVVPQRVTSSSRSGPRNSVQEFSLMWVCSLHLSSLSSFSLLLLFSIFLAPSFQAIILARLDSPVHEENEMAEQLEV